MLYINGIHYSCAADPTRARALACHLNHCAVEGCFLFSKIAPTRLYTYNNRQNRKYVPRRSMLLIPALAYFNILTARRARAEYISYPCRARSYCKSATGQKRPRAFFKLLMYRFGIRYKKRDFARPFLFALQTWRLLEIFLSETRVVVIVVTSRD